MVANMEFSGLVESNIAVVSSQNNYIPFFLMKYL